MRSNIFTYMHCFIRREYKIAQTKRRWSKERTHLRRSTWKLENKELSVCSNCGEPVLSHKACPSCGYYNKKQAVEIKAKEDKKDNN